jgi:hypothetical protein
MATLNNDSETFDTVGTLDGPAGTPIDWIEFELYNTDSDFYPTPVAFPEATDFYISSMAITTPGVRWSVNANGNWSNNANWSAAAPNGPGAKAIFGSVITAPRTVTVDAPRTVGALSFENAQSYTLAGPGPLTINGGGGGSFDVLSGSHTISAPLSIGGGNTVTKGGPGTLTISGAQTHGAGAMLVASAGLTNLNSDGGQNLSVRVGAELNFGTTQHLGGVQIDAGAVTRMIPGSSKTLVTPTLTIAGTPSAPTGKLDLNSNSAIIDYSGPSPAAAIRQQITAGRGGAGLGAAWNGMGITSGTAALNNIVEPESRSVGYANNAELPLGSYTSFRGQPVDATSVLLAYTRTGDANLDGVVNDDDVTVVGASYAPGVAGAQWSTGDFDYNGFVDDDDITLLGAFYDPSATPVAAAADVAAVPEPGGLELLACGCLASLAFAIRRRL